MGGWSVATGKTSMVTIKGDYNRVTRGLFFNGKPGGNQDRLHSAVHTEGGASHNRIDHIEVDGWQRRSIRNMRVNERTKNNLFDRNYLHNLKGPRSNSGEVFQVGTSREHASFTPNTTIEYNLVDGFDLESELSSFKTQGVIFRFNMLLNAPTGVVATRLSNDTRILFMGNYKVKGTIKDRSWAGKIFVAKASHPQRGGPRRRGHRLQGHHRTSAGDHSLSRASCTAH